MTGKKKKKKGKNIVVDGIQEQSSNLSLGWRIVQ